MVHKRRSRINDGLKVAYTNVNGLRSSAIEIEDYLREQQPDMGITEIKLTGNSALWNIGEDRYNIWMRNREHKPGGGVMLLLKKELSG